MIGEDGGSLSAGQKQLLCITRVMLCLPPMLILDEATSSIDTRTEMRIQKAFATMMRRENEFSGGTSFVNYSGSRCDSCDAGWKNRGAGKS